MYYIIEIPHEPPPRVWTTHTAAEFVDEISERIQLISPGKELVIQTTPRQLIEEYGLDSLDEARVDEPWIAALNDRLGPDTAIYQSQDGGYQAEPITSFDACKAYLASGLAHLMVIEDTSHALALTNDPGAWTFPGAEQARQALIAHLSTAACT